MDGYQTDTFQCAARLCIHQAHSYAVAETLLETSFLISCIKHPWDAVGHFLGSGVQAQNTLKTGAFRRLEYVQGVRGCTTGQPLA